jgi:CRP-like cAMP-binding protein
VNPSQNQHRRNRLLTALRPRDFALLEPHLQIVPIREGEFLHLPGDEIEQVYFLHKGIVSLMAISEDGDAIATASVGSEGAIGTIAGTGFVRAFTRAIVQAPGVASRIAVSHLRRAVSKSEAINDLLTRYHMGRVVASGGLTDSRVVCTENSVLIDYVTESPTSAAMIALLCFLASKPVLVNLVRSCRRVIGKGE